MINFLKVGILMSLIFSVVACVSSGTADNDSSGNILVIVPPVEIMDVEYEGVMNAFDGKVDVTVASTIVGEVTGQSLIAESEILISETKVDDYDAVVLIGGMGVFQHIIENEVVHQIVTDFYNQDKYVTATCGASIALAKAGLLEGLEATTYPDAGLISQIEQLGATYVDELAVVSGKIITGSGPEASDAFPAAVVEALNL